MLEATGRNGKCVSGGMVVSGYVGSSRGRHHIAFVSGQGETGLYKIVSSPKPRRRSTLSAEYEEAKRDVGANGEEV